jgi:hypothetical protein
MPPPYLFGPLPTAGSPLPSPPHQALRLTFGAADAAVPTAADDSWESIQRRLPAAWRPEAILVVLGAGTVPVGLWSAPLPLVALVPDLSIPHNFSRPLSFCEAPA